MKTEQKAKELFDKYFLLHESATDENGVWILSALNKGLAKKCALIAVDLRLDGDFIYSGIEYGEDSLGYWEQVKIEIEKL
jgi:hypothetical protein